MISEEFDLNLYNLISKLCKKSNLAKEEKTERFYETEKTIITLLLKNIQKGSLKSFLRL